MVLRWHLTFLRQGQICFPMHLYGPYTFVWEKCWEFIFWTSPLKTMIQLSWGGTSGHLVDTKQLKLMSGSKIQDGHHSRHLEIQFSTSLPKPLVHLSQNLLCSNRTTSGSKWTKIMSIGNPRWPPQLPYWKSVLDILQTTRWIKLKLTM